MFSVWAPPSVCGSESGTEICKKPIIAPDTHTHNGSVDHHQQATQAGHVIVAISCSIWPKRETESIVSLANIWPTHNSQNLLCFSIDKCNNRIEGTLLEARIRDYPLCLCVAQSQQAATFALRCVGVCIMQQQPLLLRSIDRSVLVAS